ncbi:MAG: response regulator [Bacteroidetes bacterium]|nr:response regulator [Bacteroidota bacterium]
MLADDDQDDRFFFNKALHKLDLKYLLTTAEDGEQLMDFLNQNVRDLPHVLFLDLNMPRKNGSECLKEIRQNKLLETLPVIIYSTSLHRDIADELYKNGAHYYIKKCDFDPLLKIISKALKLLTINTLQPSRDNFILS